MQDHRLVLPIWAAKSGQFGSDSLPGIHLRAACQYKVS